MVHARHGCSSFRDHSGMDRAECRSPFLSHAGSFSAFCFPSVRHLPDALLHGLPLAVLHGHFGSVPGDRLGPVGAGELRHREVRASAELEYGLALIVQHQLEVQPLLGVVDVDPGFVQSFVRIDGQLPDRLRRSPAGFTIASVWVFPSGSSPVSAIQHAFPSLSLHPFSIISLSPPSSPAHGCFFMAVGAVGTGRPPALHTGGGPTTGRQPRAVRPRRIGPCGDHWSGEEGGGMKGRVESFGTCAPAPLS